MAEEPLAKRPRVDGTDGQRLLQHPAAVTQQPPRIQTLLQVPAGLPNEPSPGAMHGCRIAAYAVPGVDNRYTSVLASGANVYWSHVAVQQQYKPEQGKEGVLLPIGLQAPRVVQLASLKHAGEVQAVALDPSPAAADELLLATADAFGCGYISRLQLPTTADVAAAEAKAAAVGTRQTAPIMLNQVKLAPPQDECREGGWAGVAFSSGTAGGTSSDNSGIAAGLMVATARGFAKDVCMFDAETGKLCQTYHCMLNPYALKFLPAGLTGNGSTLLAVAESHTISLWDARVDGISSGCVQRLATATPGQPLYTLDWCTAQGGLLGSAGAERSVCLTEPRKWRQLTKWNGATRLAVHHLAFLTKDPHYAVLAGLDLEVLCGRWDKQGSNMRAYQSSVSAEDDTAAAAAAANSSRPAVTSATPAAAAAPGSGERARAAAAAAWDADGARGLGGFSFRGDGRWLGVAKAVGDLSVHDMLAGFAASGNLVYARIR